MDISEGIEHIRISSCDSYMNREGTDHAAQPHNQEPVYVLHLITCHGHIMPCLAELLFVFKASPI